MGLYDDITADITDAFDGDLADAVKAITINSYTNSYNATTGVNTPTATTYTLRGVVTDLTEADIADEAALLNGVSILVLDNEKEVTSFEIGMKVTIAGDTQTYKLISKDSDPAYITHTLLCGRWS